MSKKKPTKTSFITQMDNDPVGNWILSLFRPRFHELQFVVLVTAVMFVPVNGSLLIMKILDYVVSQFGAVRGQDLGAVLQLLFIVGFLGNLIFLYLKFVIRRQTLHPGQKCGILLIVYFALMTCGLFAGGLREQESGQGILYGFNYWVVFIVHWVILIRFFTIWFAVRIRNRQIMGFLAKNFSDEQATTTDILLAVMTTLAVVTFLAQLNHSSYQIVLLGYIYGFAFYRVLGGIKGHIVIDGRD